MFVAVFTAAAWSITDNDEVVIATWNLRGYPEKLPAVRQWFHQNLLGLHADVLCTQEIANQQKVSQFLSTESEYKKAAFRDSPDSQDNAIFLTTNFGMEDLADPQGFQHPAQAAYIYYRGFDAVVITVHLSWTDRAKREKEKVLLKDVVTKWLKKDPDVIVVGDFNTEEPDITELANILGMIVMVPEGQEGVGTTHAGHRYDHFLISPDLANEEAVGCHIVTFSGEDDQPSRAMSDHLPVKAVFRSNENFRDRPQ